MKQLSQRINRGDWREEMHIPVIQCPNRVTPGEFFEVSVAVGKAVNHPNTAEHHIAWIALYFTPKGENAPYQIGDFAFLAHGEATSERGRVAVYTHHEASASLSVDRPGTLLALSYCTIHGLWESSKEIGFDSSAALSTTGALRKPRATEP
jgi:superoxide reductase